MTGPVDKPQPRPPEFDYNYVEEDHVKVFESSVTEVDRLVSASDFAPIQQRVHKAHKRKTDIQGEGFSYQIARWPLLALIFGLISIEFLLYITVRQIVNLVEWTSGWWGRRGMLRLRLRAAHSYQEWLLAASDLDEALGLNKWKKLDSNAYYDYALVRRVLLNLRELREKDDADGVKAVLEVCLRSNFAGTESYRLYSETFYGTKQLLLRYIDEVEEAVRYIRATPHLSLDEKAKLFKGVSKNYGGTALALSGGASFGYYHFGVIRALLDADLLPKVISGTSAGALVAAFVCTHTDEELKRMLIPELAEKITACSEPFPQWVKRLYRTGARFDTGDFARKAMFFTNGSMTFREAFERTGRILNVSVVPYDTHSPTKLLNIHTAPDCMIFSAIIASAAVPTFLNPVMLLTKNKKGEAIPWQFQGRHKDGSLRVDIPLQSLNLFFNTTFSITSQVNPHISLFAFQPRGAPGRPVSHRRGKGWRGGYILSACEQFLKLDLTKNFRVLRDLELMPEVGGTSWAHVFLQKFEGSVTIWPKVRALDFLHILSDPNEAELRRMMLAGMQQTWPKLHMISNRLRVEQQIEFARDDIRREVRQRQSSRTNSPLPPRAGDSSALDDSDSEIEHQEIDLGGPEGTEPGPDTDPEPNGAKSPLLKLKTNHLAPPLAKTRSRRKQIMSKLGLRPVYSHSPDSAGPHTAFGFGNGERVDEEDLLRRFSAGELKLGIPSGQRKFGMFGNRFTDDDFDHNGGESGDESAMESAFSAGAL